MKNTKNEVDVLQADLAALGKENDAVIERLEEEVDMWKGK